MKKYLTKIFGFIFIFFVVAIPMYNANKLAYAHSTEVTHLFTHALIAYPDIAFEKNNPMRPYYDQDCITAKEFKAILNGLYKKNYILVNPNDVYEYKLNRVVKKPFEYKNKKPLLFSFDDINYYRTKMNMGMNDKLIIDKNGKLATYTKNAKECINYDNEVITILENFIKKHPDFSYNNAKGTICLTGYDGILGYRTDRNSKNRFEETMAVKPVINKLKKLNWNFACHSYGHYHMKQLTRERFNLDTKRWKNEVEPLVGKTNIYVYPYGEHQLVNKNEICNKHEDLKKAGFNFFWGVGGNPFYQYMPLNFPFDRQSLFMDRIPLDGNTLRTFKLNEYFDVKQVYDEIRETYLN